MIGIALTLALTSAQFSMSNGAPRTSATTCDALYYGLGRAPDLAGAYRCYGADGDFAMQIIMAFNGDGVARSRRLVEKLFDAWERKAPGESLSGYTDPLRVALGSLQAGTPVQRLVFCEHLASGTQDGMRCDAIRQFVLEADATRALRRTAGSLSSEQRSAFERLRESFATFLTAEGERGYQVFVTGSIRHSAGALQEDYVREHFLSHVAAIVGRRSLRPSLDGRLRAAVGDLDAVYQADLAAHEDGEKDAMGIGAGYRVVTATAKTAWDEYRQAWMRMVVTLPIPAMAPPDAARAVETMLTLERIDELKHNILGIR
jgi:hypothetical protein